MVNRFEDLAPIIAPRGIAHGSTVGVRQGVVESWNPLTAQNTVRIGGTLFSDLPTVASSTEVLLIQPGDVVLVKVVSGSSAFATMYIEGRVTLPGTPQAGSFMDLFGVEAASEGSAVAQGHTYPTYTTAPDGLGPSVTAQIGNTRRALVTVGAFIQYHHGTGASGYRAGRISYRITEVNTGTVTTAASESRAFIMDTEGNEASLASASHTSLASGTLRFPNPGTYTFEAMYATYAADAGGQMFYGHRTLAVLPL